MCPAGIVTASSRLLPISPFLLKKRLVFWARPSLPSSVTRRRLKLLTLRTFRSIGRNSPHCYPLTKLSTPVLTLFMQDAPATFLCVDAWSGVMSRKRFLKQTLLLRLSSRHNSSSTLTSSRKPDLPVASAKKFQSKLVPNRLTWTGLISQRFSEFLQSACALFRQL